MCIKSQGVYQSDWSTRIPANPDLPFERNQFSVTSVKDWPNTNLISMGRIGFRTPTEHEVLMSRIWAARTLGECSIDHVDSQSVGYRKHAFVLRQIGVVEFYEAPRNDEQIARYVAKNYID